MTPSYNRICEETTVRHNTSMYSAWVHCPTCSNNAEQRQVASVIFLLCIQPRTHTANSWHSTTLVAAKHITAAMHQLKRQQRQSQLLSTQQWSHQLKLLSVYNTVERPLSHTSKWHKSGDTAYWLTLQIHIRWPQLTFALSHYLRNQSP